MRRWRRPEPDRPLPGLAHDCNVDGCTLTGAHRHLDLPPVGGPALRPHPAANAWPDDAILLTYGELRRLIAVHLTLCASTMPADRPWVWMKGRARAVQDGEAPLLLSEVLTQDPPDTIPPGRLTP